MGEVIPIGAADSVRRGYRYAVYEHRLVTTDGLAYISAEGPGCNPAHKLFYQSFCILQYDGGLFPDEMPYGLFNAPAAGVPKHPSLVDVVFLKGIFIDGAVFGA